MDKNRAPGAEPEDKAAAPQGEHTSNRERTEETAAMSDEELRRHAVGRLAEQLDIGSSLTERCEHLAALPGGDRLGAIYAAARLMRANAFVAQALANVAQVERRRRSIIERIEPPDPKVAELNAGLQKEKLTSEQRLKIWNRMNEHIEQTIRARTGDPNAADSVSRLIKHEEKELERLRKQCEEAGLA